MIIISTSTRYRMMISEPMESQVAGRSQMPINAANAKKKIIANSNSRVTSWLCEKYHFNLVFHTKLQLVPTINMVQVNIYIVIRLI